MRNRKIRLALIMGSDREGRFCDTITRWVLGQIQDREELDVRVVDPRQTGSGDGAVAVQQALAQADAFVVVTPEYNHSFPAPLKAIIDGASEEWQARPVAFVSYGGISGGLRAVEQLRQVFAELHAVTIRDTVSFANPWDRFDKDGRLRDPEQAERSMDTLLSYLVWWAGVLQGAREKQPYGEVKA